MSNDYKSGMDNEAMTAEEERRMELEAARRHDAAEAAAEEGELAEGGAAPGREARDFSTPLLLLGAAKDGLDWMVDLIGIGEIPFIGQIPGILFTLFIVFYLVQNGLLRQSLTKRAVAYGGFIIDNLPFLINNIPFMTPALWILRRVGRPTHGRTAGAT